MASPYDQCIENYKYVFQPDLLRGKVALITGGGSGIGFTITEVLMRHGCACAIASRSKARTVEAAQRLEQATGGKCFALAMDIRKVATIPKGWPQEVITAVDEVLRHYGKIDFLINNAAGNFLSPLSGMSYNAYKTVIEIDTIGTFNCSKTVYDKFFKDNGGVIVNISAIMHMRGIMLQAHAGSAKAAIDALTKHMAVEWGPQNIRIVGLSPGPIAETEGMRKLGGRSRAIQELEKIPFIPLQRWGHKREMAHGVLFLVSDACPYITGTTIVADGGAWLTQPNDLSHAEMRIGQALQNDKSKVSAKL